MAPFKAPYFTQAEICRRAGDFLARRNASGEIPVPIERIVEGMGVDIVPVPNLLRSFNIDGWTTHDLSEIYVDQHCYDNVETRFRFTLAHELGHIELHAAVFKPFQFRTVAQWQRFVESVDIKQWEYLEHHANEFAAQVLMPSDALVRTHKGCSELVLRQLQNSAMSPLASCTLSPCASRSDSTFRRRPPRSGSRTSRCFGEALESEDRPLTCPEIAVRPSPPLPLSEPRHATLASCFPQLPPRASERALVHLRERHVDVRARLRGAVRREPGGGLGRRELREADVGDAPPRPHERRVDRVDVLVERQQEQVFAALAEEAVGHVEELADLVEMFTAAFLEEEVGAVFHDEEAAAADGRGFVVVVIAEGIVEAERFGGLRAPSAPAGRFCGFARDLVVVARVAREAFGVEDDEEIEAFAPLHHEGADGPGLAGARGAVPDEEAAAGPGGFVGEEAVERGEDGGGVVGADAVPGGGAQELARTLDGVFGPVAELGPDAVLVLVVAAAMGLEPLQQSIEEVAGVEGARVEEEVDAPDAEREDEQVVGAAEDVVFAPGPAREDGFVICEEGEDRLRRDRGIRREGPARRGPGGEALEGLQQGPLANYLVEVVGLEDEVFDEGHGISMVKGAGFR
ncbi:MAG: ImmA/IrrE family metallo-endopeptidase [Planctomycetes bacterium]|nr:ImmA/IrrE family metallo-endopeptidase [Planctomycetota bacterium]